MDVLKLIWILLLTLLSQGMINSQQAYFVSNSGSDANEGSLEFPYRTIPFSMNTLIPGDTLFVRAGVYQESLDVQVSGKKDHPILLSVWNNEEVILESKVNNGIDAMINIDGQKHIILRGLNLTASTIQSTHAGIELNACDSIVVENMFIEGFAKGIYVHNEGSDSISRQIMIRNNVLLKNSGQGIIIGPEDSNVQESYIESLVLRNNTFFYNDFIGNNKGEIKISNCQNAVISSNLFYMDSDAFLGEIEQYYFNLFLDYNAYYTKAGMEQFAFNYNGQSYSAFAQLKDIYEKEDNGFFLDPGLMDVSFENPDVHLRPNSALIHKGEPGLIIENSEVDIDGEMRSDGLLDIGADEFYPQLIICSLSALTGELNESEVNLYWSGTCFSSNGGSYQILRSNPQDEFEKIDELFAQKEKLNTQVSYSYKDTQPLEGINIYKIRFIDNNGDHIDSNILPIYFSNDELVFFPNPANSFVEILLEEESNYELYLYSELGELIINYKLKDKYIDVSFLSTGVYVIKLLNTKNNASFTKKLIIH